jgi:hypothetical protein
MEHIENDMDDLFQKAGELYPLKTIGSDWDAVAGKLQNEMPDEVRDITGPTSLRTRNKRKWLLLLLLIPLGLGISYYSGQKNPGHQNTLSAKPLSNTSDQNKINSVTPDSHSATSRTADDNKTTATSGSERDSKSDNNKTAASDNIQSRSDKTNRSGNAVMNGTPSSNNRKPAYAAAGGKQLKPNNTPYSQKQVSSADEKTKSDLNSNNSGRESSSSDFESAPKAAVAVIPSAVSTQNESAAVKNNTDKTESSKKASQDSSQTSKKTNTASKQSKGFYVGLFGGPDLSAVKFQGVHQVGSGFGISLGYRLNKLAFETGLIWDQKYYYSSGEYFKTSPSYYYPPNTTFSGHCDMFEIPLLLRYDFTPDKKHGFFAKAGFSSYLMTHQYYSKKVDGVDMGSWPWTEPANYLFSIVQLSGGYEFSINAKTKIQIEPYIKIPLRGLGEGNMPISSAGVYFGITHSFR